MNTKNKIISGLILLFFIIVVMLIFKHRPPDEAITPSVLVKVTHAQYTSMPKKITTYGTVGFSPEQVKQISLQSEVLVEKIFVTQGEQVKKNDNLLKVIPTANANLSLLNAKITVDFAQKELIRLEKLRDQFLATNLEVANAKQNLAKSQAELLNLQAQQKNGNENFLQASEKGMILSVNVQAGQLVSPMTTLLSIARGDGRQIRLGVENEDLSDVQIGQKVIITSLQNEQLSFVASVKMITGQVDPTTGLIDVIVPLDQAEKLIAGSVVRGEIFIKVNSHILVVPHSAILYQGNKPYLFVVTNGKASQRWINVGEDNGQLVSIQSGLKENEHVVIVGNYELTEGMNVRLEPSK